MPQRGEGQSQIRKGLLSLCGSHYFQLPHLNQTKRQVKNAASHMRGLCIHQRQFCSLLLYASNAEPDQGKQHQCR